MTQSLLAFNELAPGAQIGIQTSDRGVISGTAVAGGSAASSSPLSPQPSTLQGSIIVDPANATGVATATGTATATVDGITGRVFSSWANLVAAWGTTSPTFDTTTQITWASAGPATDPVYFQPLSIAPISVTLRAPLVSVATGVVLASVVAKNRATNTILQADLGAARTAGMLVVNTTRNNSVAHVESLVAGNVWNLTQPFDPLAPGGSPVGTLVDTWANGDVVNIFTFTKIFVTEFAPRLSGISTNGSSVYAYLYRMQVQGVNVAGGILLGAVNVFESNSQTGFIFDPSNGQCNFTNHFFQFGSSVSKSAEVVTVRGGATGLTGFLSFFSRVLILDADVILRAVVTFDGGVLRVSLVYLGLTGDLIRMDSGQVQFINGNYGAHVVYGVAGAQINLRGSVNGFQSGSFTAGFVAPALVNPGIRLNSLSTASAENGATPTVINGLIPTTVANLDAAFGVAGFGGVAFNLGGASIRNTTQ